MLRFPKKNTSSLAKYRKAARAAFQLRRRLEEALDGSGFCQCFTCSKWFHYKEGDGGHYVSAEYNTHCFDPKNVNFQCVYCNQHLEGNKGMYARHLDVLYGPDTAKIMDGTKKKTKMSRFEYEHITKVNRKLCREIKKKKGLS